MKFSTNKLFSQPTYMIRMGINVYKCVYLCLYQCTLGKTISLIYIYIYIYTYMCVYIYIYIYIYVCVYIYIYIYKVNYFAKTKCIFNYPFILPYSTLWRTKECEVLLVAHPRFDLPKKKKKIKKENEKTADPIAQNIRGANRDGLGKGNMKSAVVGQLVQKN